MYIPPFKYTDRIVNLVADICRQIELFAPEANDEDRLRLRKANRIKTIHSSLAIEGNTLTEGKVRDIIDGKAVMAPLREVQEVKNAIATYELYPTLNPFDGTGRDVAVHRVHAGRDPALAQGASGRGHQH